MDDKPGKKGFQTHAWWILFVFEILMVLNIILVVAFFEGPDAFQADTGVAWADFSQTYPTVAAAFQLEQGVAFTGLTGMTLFALFVTFFAFRQGHRWAWFAMWVFPAAITLIAIQFVISERPDLGAYYGIFAVIAVVGLLLPIRRFFHDN